jgi:hypothetical protein
VIFFDRREENPRAPRLVVVIDDHTGDTMGYRR